MVETESLISDIRKILDNENPWHVAKRPYYDPHRLLERAAMQIETLLERIEDCEEVIQEHRESLKDLEHQLCDLEKEVAELQDTDRGFS